MATRVVFTRAAVREARDARIAFRSRAPETVEGFRQRLREARRTLEEYPLAGPQIGGEARRLNLSPYPYSLIYRVAGEQVEVFAVPHAKQSAYWRDR